MYTCVTVLAIGWLGGPTADVAMQSSRFLIVGAWEHQWSNCIMVWTFSRDGRYSKTLIPIDGDGEAFTESGTYTVQGRELQLKWKTGGVGKCEILQLDAKALSFSLGTFKHRGYRRIYR